MKDDFKFRTYLHHRPRRFCHLAVILALPLAIAAGALLGALEPGAAVGPPLGAVPAETRTLSLPLGVPEPTGADQQPNVKTALLSSSNPRAAPSPAASLLRSSRDQRPPPPAAASARAEQDEPEAGAERWVEHEVRSGDSIARIFKGFGLSATLLQHILHSSPKAKRLADIRPGQTLSIRLTGEGDLAELVLQSGPRSSLRIVHDSDGFKAREIERQVETRTERVSGVIEESLYASARKAGLSEKLILELADIFGWDIDFALEVRSGDQFNVIYREDYLDGDKLSDGPILAAEFVNQGRGLRAVRYKNKQGDVDYYSPDGRPMHKAFLRAPVDFRRISSRFQTERYHPILGKRRPHRGVDYAAAVGTPVRAAGDGKVAFVGRKGGYGNTVVIQHAGSYSSLYAHLNGFRHGLKSGSHVKQGQVIAYVGQTGLATGPHLHYEFRINGVHRDPLTVKLPQAAPIAARYRADFDKNASPLLAQLDLLDRTMVAETH